jgi:hypothetical protein
MVGLDPIGKAAVATLSYHERAATRGREILHLHKFVLVATAVVVVWAILFKLP